MALKNAEYWRKRSEEIIEHNLNITQEELATKLHGHYVEALKGINDDIEKWLYRLSSNNEISMAEARKWLKKNELDEFKYDIETYLRLGRAQNERFDEAIARQLENASVRVHISRLEEIKTRMLMHVETLYGKQEDLTRIAGVRMITNTHKSLVGEFEGIVPFIDEAKALQMISEPWAQDGSDFSDKIWKNKHGLMSNIDKDITQGVIRGDSYGKLTQKMAKELNASEGAAGRLIMTESTAFSSLSQIETFKGLDVKKVEIVETIDSHTCSECSSMNGRVLDLSDVEIGFTAPPFHPWCRGSLCPHNDEYDEVFGHDDIDLPKSLGAKAKPIKVDLGNGKRGYLQDGGVITNVRVVAGKGSNIEFRDKHYYSNAKMRPESLSKMAGMCKVEYNGDIRDAEVHWIESNGDRFNFKVKRWL